MKTRLIAGTSLAVALLIGSTWAAEEVKSGLEVGKRVAAFHPLHVTGDSAGQKQCLV